MVRTTLRLLAAGVFLIVCADHDPRYNSWSMSDVARADTLIGCQLSSCDAQNQLVPNCPAAPCYKCQFSSGTRMVFGQGDNGWIVSGAFICGPVVWGVCINNVCVVMGLTPFTCHDLALVTQQPLAGR